jgi:hypothetical protein
MKLIEMPGIQFSSRSALVEAESITKKRPGIPNAKHWALGVRVLTGTALQSDRLCINVYARTVGKIRGCM